MKKHYRSLAVLISCVMACGMPISAVCSEAAPSGDTAVAAETEQAAIQTENEEEKAEEESSEEAVVVAEDEAASSDTGMDNALDTFSDNDADSAEEDDDENGPAPVAEETTVTFGDCGEELNWEFSDGVLSIQGTGMMYDYDKEHMPEWAVYGEKVRELRFGKGITLIDGDAFTGLINLEIIHYEGSEKAWEDLEYTGEKEKSEVFAGVTEYFFDEVESEEVSEEAGKPAKAAAVGLEIVTEPEDVSAEAGENVSLHVEANLEDAYYQWQWSKDGTTWKDCSSAGHDTDTFGFVMKETLDGRYYRCLVFDDSDEVISKSARISLAVNEPLDITRQPEDVTASAGENVSLHVEANKADAEYQWQWSKDGKTWRNCTSAGCNTATFGFVMKETLSGRLYRCMVTFGSEQVISEGAVITYEAAEPLGITQQPEDVTAAAGDNVSFHVEANKADALYQWQWSKDGKTWKNCTSAGFNTNTFGFVMKETLGGRLYRCVVTSGSEEITSDGAVVTYEAAEPLEITQQPEDVTVAAGENVSFHVEANKADAEYQWQWSKDGKTWKNCTSVGFNTDTFGFAMKETLSGRLYRCVVTSGDEQVTSEGAVVTIDVPLMITLNPESVEAAAGERVSLHVEANKADVGFRWQWSADGNIWKNCSSAGYNTDTFSFQMKESLNGRVYRCTVTSGDESVVSEGALITFKNPQIEIDGVIYELIDDVMTVTGYVGNSDTVIVQETVEGRTVTVIGESAFEGSSIRSIDLPDTIQLIKKRAFADCSNLMNMD